MHNDPRTATRGARRKAALLAALLAYTGCTQRLYEGAPQPRRDVAVLDATGSLLWSIDGERMYAHPLGYIRYELSPGAHSIVVRYETPDEPAAIRRPERQVSPYDCSMVLIAEAGATYRLQSRAIGLDARRKRWDGRWEAWVSRDGGDGEPIAHCMAVDESGGATSSQATHAATSGGAARAPATRPDDALPVSGAAGAGVGSAGATSDAVPAESARASTPTATPRVPVPTQIRLGTWNLHGLGRGGERDVERIAAIIDESFDVVVLTELFTRADNVAHSALAASLGNDWLWLADPSEASVQRERYVFAYRRTALRACPGWEQPRPYAPRQGESFARPPIFTCLQTPPGDVPPSFDFLLAAYRADWGDGDLTAVAAEVGQLDSVFAAMRESRPDERDLMIAGDFNLGPRDLRALIAAAPVAHGDGSTLDLRGERSALLADQILVLDPQASREMRGMAEAKDVRTAHGDARSFVAAVSDHLPVLLRLDPRGPDDD